MHWPEGLLLWYLLFNLAICRVVTCSTLAARPVEPWHAVTWTLHLHARITVSSCQAVHTGICCFINTLSLSAFWFSFLWSLHPRHRAGRVQSIHQSSPAQYSKCYFRYRLLHLRGVWLCIPIVQCCTVTTTQHILSTDQNSAVQQCSAVQSTLVSCHQQTIALLHTNCQHKKLLFCC